MSTPIDPASIMLPFEERFDTALRTWDPLEDCAVLKWLDPVSSAEGAKPSVGRIHLLRLIGFILVISSPPVLLSLVPSSAAGGRFWGHNGMYKDFFYFYINYIMLPALTLLLVYGRRALGDMVNRVNLVFGVHLPIDLRVSTAPPILRVLERLTRVSTLPSVFWIAVFLLINAMGYLAHFKAPEPIWLVSPAESSTLLHFAKLGQSQPNFAGLYATLCGGPAVAYIMLLVVRLIIEFALACAQMAQYLLGHVMPAHPDNCGGLLPVGRIALLLSLPIMLVGIAQTVVTLQEILIWHRPPLSVVSLDWVVYLLLSPVLFLLPLLPLRRLMYRSKFAYLHKLEELYRSMDRTAEIWSATDSVKPSRILDQFAIVQLIERVEKMSVWPFDRKTFIRFAAVVLSPIVPLLGSAPGEMAKKVLEWLSKVVLHK
jgi:low affinity Fe/Cu permease